MNDEKKLYDAEIQDIDIDEIASADEALISPDENNNVLSQIKNFFVGAYNKYYDSLTPEDDSKKVSPKQAYIKIAVATLSVLIFIAGILMFLTMYPYYTTGLTVDEFIHNFNSITLPSDSDLYTLIPDYEEILIPEDAKLGGDDVIKLMDDQVVISAKTRGKKIVELYVDANNLKNYDTSIYYFDIADQSNTKEFYYFYMIYGKVMTAFDTQEMFSVDADKLTSESDVLIVDSLAAASAAYNEHYSALMNVNYGGDAGVQRVIGNNSERVCSYRIDTLNMTISPYKTTIIDEIVWPEINFGSGVTDKTGSSGTTDIADTDDGTQTETVSSADTVS